MVLWTRLLGLGLHLLTDRRHRGVRPGHGRAGLAQMAIQGIMSHSVRPFPAAASNVLICSRGWDGRTAIEEVQI